MTDEEYMRLAIQEAKNSEKAGGAPIGAIIVKDEIVIAHGWSMVWPEKDPASHAETNCIKAACKALQTIDLTGCTLYGTCETCSMCLACGSWAGLSKVVFGAYKEHLRPNPYEIADYHAEDWAHRLTPQNGKHMEIYGGVLESECIQLMNRIENWTLMT